MARPKSEEKRLAILNAATEIVADKGIGAATAQIAKLAGVAEGTLFRYFANKELLLNQLYLHIKLDLSGVVTSDLKKYTSAKQSAFAVWDHYINWAIQNPRANNAMTQLAVSGLISDDTHQQVKAMFPSIEGISDICATDEAFYMLNSAFADAIFVALADVTIRFVLREPQHDSRYKQSGFEALWRALTETMS